MDVGDTEELRQRRVDKREDSAHSDPLITEVVSGRQIIARRAQKKRDAKSTPT